MHLPTETQLWHARLLTDQLPGEAQHAHHGAGHHTTRVSNLARAPAGSIMHGRPAQCSLHSAPICRRLLKVAAPEAQQCDITSLAGPNGPRSRPSTRAREPHPVGGTMRDCFFDRAKQLHTHAVTHGMRRATLHVLAVCLCIYLRLQRLSIRLLHP